MKTAFYVARPAIVSRILQPGQDFMVHMTAALLAEMQDVRGSCELSRIARLTFGTLGAFAKEVWRLLCCGGRIAKFVLWKAEEKRRAKGWGLSFGGQHDNEYTLRGMMWADSYWLFSDCGGIDLHGERHYRGAVGPGQWSPKLESLWWTSTYKHEDMRTLRVRGRDKMPGISPFAKSFDALGYRFHRDGMGFQGVPSAACARL